MPTPLPRFTLHQPGSLAEASDLLRTLGDDARAYAGGTELLLAMKQGVLRYGHLVDLKTIPDLDGIVRAGGVLRIGALATHGALERSALIGEALPLLVQVERQVANVRVRTSGTLGGNLCFGEPHSDPAPVLLCLGARVVTSGPGGQRTRALQDFLFGPFEVALADGELLEAVEVPLLAPSHRTAYERYRTREYPMLGLAVLLDLDQGGASVRSARVAIGSASPVPRRSPVAEAVLEGPTAPIRHRIGDAAEALADAAALEDDLDGSAQYKRHLIHVLLGRAVERALHDRAETIS